MSEMTPNETSVLKSIFKFFDGNLGIDFVPFFKKVNCTLRHALTHTKKNEKGYMCKNVYCRFKIYKNKLRCTEKKEIFCAKLVKEHQKIFTKSMKEPKISSEAKKFHCSQCSKKFSSNRALKKHCSDLHQSTLHSHLSIVNITFEDENTCKIIEVLQRYYQGIIS